MTRVSGPRLPRNASRRIYNVLAERTLEVTVLPRILAGFTTARDA